jgi:GTPase SAR1 family protein
MIIQEKLNKILETKAFDNQHKKYSDIPKDLPQPPFSLLLVGSKGAGKSNLILNLVYKSKPKKLYRNFFDKVYVFSPTWKLDPKMSRCKVPDEQIFEDPNSYREVIEEIVGIQGDSVEEIGKEDTEHILMIFSDVCGCKNVFTQGKGIMNKLAFNLRHYKISLIIDAQSLRQINSAFRNNLSAIILFSGITNRLELKKIYDEYLGSFTKEEQDKLIEYCFKEPYSFLYINLQKQEKDRYYHNFNQLTIRKE